MADNPWEAALASAASRPLEVEGYARVRLGNGERVVCREVYRHANVVNRPLLAVFRDLVEGRKRWPLYLHGGVGTGKTRAALVFCDLVAYPQYWTVERVVDGIIQRNSQGPPWEWPTKPDLIVLDELGTRQQVGDLHYQAVKEFADWRERTGRNVAVYISNHSPDVLEGLYDYRITSRLTCGTVFALTGKDLRMT